MDGSEIDPSALSGIRELRDFGAWGDLTGGILAALQESTVHSFCVNDCRQEIDLGMMPQVTDRLELHNLSKLTDLSGMRSPGPHTLQLDNLQGLTSLNGIRELIGEGGIREIRIGSCPRLTDWSALEGTDLQKIVICGDLVFLPESLQGIAERTDGQDEWWQDAGGFSVSSMEELKAMPPEVKKLISGLQIIGDEVYDPDRYEPRDWWDDERHEQVVFVFDRETGEQTEVPRGTMTDLSILEGMEGLEWLQIRGQALESLAGIENCTRLREAWITCCSNLTDASALYSLPEIESIDLSQTGVASIEGIGMNGKLRNLTVNNAAVTDLSPLAGIDYTYAMENGGFNLGIDGQQVTNASALSAIRVFTGLHMGSVDGSLWADAVKDAKIFNLTAFCIPDQQTFAALMAAHPELENMNIPWNHNVTDLSMLADMPNLRFVSISNTMEKAVQSLQGRELRFELEIQ